MNLSSTNLSNRRNFLKGRSVLALPFLKVVRSRHLLRSNHSNQRMLAIGNHLGFYPGAFFPKDAGSDYISSPTLRNIEKHREDFTVFPP